jgi:two-component system chemotaxis response regulator CheB
MRKIRVLVVEDSLLFRELLVQNLNKDPGIEVIATARDPFEARDRIIEYRPDVMTLDIEMPRMDGIEFLRKLMPQYPIPVIMISSLSEKVFDAMNAGAVDFVAKPSNATREQIETFIRTELPVKIKIASIAKVGSRRGDSISLASPPAGTAARTGADDVIVAIGASTGGTEAIASLIQEFREDIPGIVIVQHMPAGFTEMYAKRLDDRSRIRVREAKDGDQVLPGQALLAPGGDAQMKLVKVGGRYQVSIRQAPKVNGHCPSVEVLFDSVAKSAKNRAIGIILTGMGGDGAKGLLAMREAGARTIGQDESTCVVYGMPRVAYESGAVEFQEKLGDIPKRTYQLLNKM